MSGYDLDAEVAKVVAATGLPDDEAEAMIRSVAGELVSQRIERDFERGWDD